jgi:hypothetical protein
MAEKQCFTRRSPARLNMPSRTACVYRLSNKYAAQDPGSGNYYLAVLSE